MKTVNLLIVIASLAVLSTSVLLPYCLFPPILYALFPILPALKLSLTLMREGDYLMRRMKLLLILSFLTVSLINTIALLTVGDAMKEILCYGFAFPLAYSGGMVLIDELRGRRYDFFGFSDFLKSERGCALLTIVLLYVLFSPKLVLPPQSLYLYWVMKSIWHLMFLPWVYYLLAIWKKRVVRGPI